MDAFETRFEREVVAALVETEESRVNGIANGVADNYHEYRERVGYIAGIRAALSVIEQVHKKMSSNND